jgi:predicted transcriptional regulator
MNFSIHLPQPLLLNLDQFAKAHNTSRSSVVREAVQAYLAREKKSEWPADLLAWMQEGLEPGFQPESDDGPDWEAIRRESNEGWEAQTEAFLKDFGTLA